MFGISQGVVIVVAVVVVVLVIVAIVMIVQAVVVVVVVVVLVVVCSRSSCRSSCSRSGSSISSCSGCKGRKWEVVGSSQNYLIGWLSWTQPSLRRQESSLPLKTKLIVGGCNNSILASVTATVIKNKLVV
jgi:hypothetical protein